MLVTLILLIKRFMIFLNLPWKCWRAFIVVCGLAVWEAPLARADYNPNRIGFCTTYPTSYKGWQSSFLAGNGKIGIMVFGDPLNETVIYNDRGFNLAGNGSRTFAQISDTDLETIKDDCVKGDFETADKLASSATHWQDGGDGSRHPGYAMYITIPEGGAISNYSRVCNFRTGEITVKWTDDRGDWERKAFISRKDNVIVQSITAPTRGTLNCSIHLGTDPGMGLPHEMKFEQRFDDTDLNIRATYKPNQTAGYEGVTRYVIEGGAHSIDDNVLTIKDAKSVMLLTRTAKYRENCEDDWNKLQIQKDLAALPTDYNKLLKGQIATHEAIYDRVKIDLGASAEERAKSNEELLAEQKKSSLPVAALWERIFDGGRYYFLSSSSDMTPPDLLGMWNGDSNAGWGGYYHLDANLNLQIAGGNIGDMPEAMAGYFNINESWRPDFETNAKKLLGCRGMLAGGNTPGLGVGLISALSDDYPYQYATGEEGWLLYPFWEHYLITGDTAFLKKDLYPLLRDMGDFYEDFLTKKDSNGDYIFAGSVSPENKPSNTRVSLANNSTFDISGAKFCLKTLIETCNILGLDQGKGQGVEKWTEILNHLPPYLITSDGALEEWDWPGIKDSFIHRHSSLLLDVWPFRAITPEDEPDYFKAACVTLSKKDQGNYETAGHGILHAALIAAGLKNEQSVTTHLLQLTKNGFYFDGLASSHYEKHGVFCTDTCNAMPGIMMEMLISSSPGVLEFLPALPARLVHGAIAGVKGRNRTTVESLSWDMSANTVNATVKSDIDQDITLIERSGIKTLQSGAPLGVSPLGDIARIIHLKAGISTPLSLALGELRPHKLNLALNQPVVASSTADSSPPANAVDEDATTRWSSAYTDHEWIYVDLGSERQIEEIKLDWEHAAGRDYDFEVSDDAQNWTTVKSVQGNTGGGWLDYPGLNAHGRYVRMNGKARTTQYGFSLLEFQVFGS
jgi:alpha-L-fucosidase 2